jgi:CHAD domain-containing protein
MTKAWPVKNLDPAGLVDVNARRILAVRIAEFYSHAPALDDEDAVETLHEMRIAAKRLRYSLELFRDLYGKKGEQQIDRVKQLQEELGHIHDIDVRIELIEQELLAVAHEQIEHLSRSLTKAAPDEQRAIITAALRPPPDDARRGLFALLGRQHAARRQHREKLVKMWNEFGAEGFRADLVKLSSQTLSKP